MDAPSLVATGNRQQATRYTRHHLTSFFYILVIAFSIMAMAKPAHAVGAVSASFTYSGGISSTYRSCNFMASIDAVKSCTLDVHDHWLAEDVNGLNAIPSAWPKPLSCPTSVLTDYGPSADGRYVDVFAVTAYRGSYNIWNGYNVFCNGPHDHLYAVYKRLSCPTNSTGTPGTNPPTCTCNDPYTPDATATSCVQEQYTLKQNEALLPDVEPGSSRAVTARVVSDQTGLPKQGAVVKIHLEVDLTSGGHDHGEKFARRPRGNISGRNCVSDPDGTVPDTYDCTTGPDGHVDFTFNAPEVSGTQNITASCISPQCSGSITDHINVKVDGLWPILASSYYELTEDGSSKIIGSTAEHGSNHYLTSDAQEQLWLLAQAFFEYQIRNGIANPTLLHINDASLEWGGKFDIKGKWAGKHKEHRRGTVIDIRANSASGAIPSVLTMNFKKIAKDFGVDAHLEYDNDPVMRHFHTRLLNRKE